MTNSNFDPNNDPINSDILNLFDFDDVEETDPIDPADDTPDKPDPDQTDDTDDQNEPDETVQAYFDFLKENEVLNVPEDFKFDGTQESLDEALSLTKDTIKQQTAEAIWTALPEDFKPLLSYALNGGKDLQSYLKAFSPNDFESFPLDTEDGQKNILREYYKQTSKHSPEKIERMINRIAETEELEQEAKDSYQELQDLKTQRQKQLNDKAVEEETARIKSAQAAVANLTTAIESSTFIEPTRKDKVKGFFLNKVPTDNGYTNGFNYVINSILSKPEHQVQLADLLMDYDPKEGFSLTRIQKKAQTEKTKSFKNYLETKINDKLPTRGSSTFKPSKDTFDWESFNKA